LKFVPAFLKFSEIARREFEIFEICPRGLKCFEIKLRFEALSLTNHFLKISAKIFHWYSKNAWLNSLQNVNWWSFIHIWWPRKRYK
jgi:hypothetical protein